MRSTTTYTTLLTCLCLLGTTLLSAQGTEKVLVKNFNLQNQTQLALQLEGLVEVRTWAQNTVRVMMTIESQQLHAATFKSLLTAGRYQLKGEPLEDAYQIITPNLHREVRIGGNLITEDISYVVYVPEQVQMQAAGPGDTPQP